MGRSGQGCVAGASERVSRGLAFLSQAVGTGVGGDSLLERPHLPLGVGRGWRSVRKPEGDKLPYGQGFSRSQAQTGPAQALLAGPEWEQGCGVPQTPPARVLLGRQLRFQESGGRRRWRLTPSAEAVTEPESPPSPLQAQAWVLPAASWRSPELLCVQPGKRPRSREADAGRRMKKNLSHKPASKWWRGPRGGPTEARGRGRLLQGG